MSSQTIVDELVKVGIDAEPYKRGPEGAFPFVASITPKRDGVVRIWEGHSNVKVYGDADHRQAVVNVKEAKTEITRNVNVRVEWNPGSPKRGLAPGTAGYFTVGWRKFIPTETRGLQNRIRSLARNNFPVFVPRPTWKISITPEGHEILQRMAEFKSFQARNIAVSVTATSRPSAEGQHLLMGFDEKYHFIAALKRPVTSVEAAHKQLRPKEVPEGTLRQGEWFFNSVDEDLAEKLDTYSTTIRGNRLPVFAGQLERGSTHRGTQLVRYDNGLYAYGFITDSRTGHHEKLFLPEWHKVVRNEEVVIRTAVPARRRAVRRWD